MEFNRTLVKLHCNLQPANALAIIEEVAEAVLKARPELKIHMKDFPDFKVVGERMIHAWGDGVKMTCGPRCC